MGHRSADVQPAFASVTRVLQHEGHGARRCLLFATSSFLLLLFFLVLLPLLFGTLERERSVSDVAVLKLGQVGHFLLVELEIERPPSWWLTSSKERNKDALELADRRSTATRSAPVTRHEYLKQRRCERHRAHVGQPWRAGLVLQVLQEFVALTKQLCTHGE